VCVGTSWDEGVLPLRSVFDGFMDPVERDFFAEQERNLLYVAFTRAREHVLVSYSGRPSTLLNKLPA